MTTEQQALLDTATKILEMIDNSSHDKSLMLYGVVRASVAVGAWSQELEDRWRDSYEDVA